MSNPIRVKLVDGPFPHHDGKGLINVNAPQHALDFWERWKGKEIVVDYYGQSPRCETEVFIVLGPPAVIEDLMETFGIRDTSVCRHILEIGD